MAYYILFSKIISRIRAAAQLDKVVAYGLITRVWALISGPVTIVLMASNFSAEMQGYYYTFASMIGLQIFIELGFSVVILQFLSHEWAGLRLNRQGVIEGDIGSFMKLAGIFIFSVRWYLICALILFVTLSLIGCLFLSVHSGEDIVWVMPWVLLCFATALNMSMLPFITFIEAIGEQKFVYKIRLISAIINSMLVWILIYLKYDLWVGAICAFAVFFYTLANLVLNYKNLFEQIYKCANKTNRMNWRQDVFPMQWRIAVSWISGYFIYSSFVPIIFTYQGPVLAGSMGMTLAIVNVVSMVASAWVTPKAPTFTTLIAKRKYAELDQLFVQISKIVITVSLITTVLIWFFVVKLGGLGVLFFEKIYMRLLPESSFILFLLSSFVYSCIGTMPVYLRAHRREPLMYYSIFYAFAVFLSTIIFAKYFSIEEVAIVNLLINIFFSFVMYLVWRICKRNWH